ncbi:VOC family protein [Stutzerimonas nosocomialis]|uniref:VOC family protein n=1 Tax=Stutzerimonas nosocomialis TaxID=1056496 RepID=A0A5R9QAX9_9GAMM|nr:VOC family protein [Stutzerimonas nosocomialis]TLX62251.1 VOC family protein [Stutzerimonas nosocomialis]
MADDSNPSILSHVSLGTNRFDEAAAFYDKVLSTLGCRRVLEHPGAVAWGRDYPEFWLQRPLDGRPSSCGNGTHVGFIANDRAAVDAFHAAALAAGATDEGAPGPRPHYGEPYYGCFVRDLDGHKIEAAYWAEG